jgi:hypothetical protein
MRLEAGKAAQKKYWGGLEGRIVMPGRRPAQTPCAHRWARAWVSNSGPWAKFGPRGNYIWPARQYQITTRAGPPVLYSAFTTNTTNPIMLCCFRAPIRTGPRNALSSVTVVIAT